MHSRCPIPNKYEKISKLFKNVLNLYFHIILLPPPDAKESSCIRTSNKSKIFEEKNITHKKRNIVPTKATLMENFIFDFNNIIIEGITKAKRAPLLALIIKTGNDKIIVMRDIAIGKRLLGACAYPDPHQH